MPTLKIACATLNQTPLDWKGNLQHIKEAILEAKSQQVELLCFPELAITGYGSEDLFLSYWFPKKAVSFLKELTPLCDTITVAVGLPVRIHEKVYNCMAILEDGKIKGIVAKQFMAIDGVHYEFRWFTPWQHGRVTSIEVDGVAVPLGDIIFELKGHTYGFEICEDAWRGDIRPGFRLKEKNVDMIFSPSASHFAMGKSISREELVCRSSKLFETTYIYVNLLGNETGRMIFDGEILAAKNGKLFVKNDLLSFLDFQVVAFDLPSKQSEVVDLERPHDKKLEFVKATSLGLFDYLRKSKSKGFVLSLSGGADSSTVAILVAEMVKRGIAELGIERFVEKLGIDLKITEENPQKEITKQLLTTAYQASENSSFATYQSAKFLAESIGAEFLHWVISDEVASYTHKIESALGTRLIWQLDDITLQNIQARARSPIIWMLTNIKNALLLATSNRSEGSVGYTTMDGDTSGSISPIAAVDKSFIISWLQWAEKELGYSGLAKVNSLQPTAELRPNETQQTDEKDLMPYPILLEIEKLAIRDRRSPVDVFLNLKEELDVPSESLREYIRKFFRLWSRNQWKRERLAPSFHLDEYNVDPKTWYRFPILSGGFEEELKELDDH